MSENNVNQVVGTTASTGDLVKLMSEISANTDRPVSQTEAHNALSLMKAAILELLKKGQKVQITGFVSFVPTYRPTRRANNVLTNEPLVIPEGITINVKAGSVLKAIPKEISETDFDQLKSIALSKRKEVQ